MAIVPSVAAYDELGQKFTEDNKTFGCSVRGGEICGHGERAKRVTYDKIPVHCAGTKILRSRHYGSLVASDARDTGDFEERKQK